jgi:hypothetical protein
MHRMTIEEFEAEKKTILSCLPEQFHSAVAQKAWNDGHSSGFNEVLDNLEELVDMLDAPIRSFQLALLHTSRRC